MTRSFRDALGAFLAEITPQPWDYTTADGSTLTIVPAGFRADRDDAEVIVRIGDVEEWVKTPDVQRLVDALRAGDSWTSVYAGWGVEVTVAGDGVTVAVHERDVVTSAVLPVEQRLPFASALARALDVARAWEDGGAGEFA